MHELINMYECVYLTKYLIITIIHFYILNFYIYINLKIFFYDYRKKKLLQLDITY